VNPMLSSKYRAVRETPINDNVGLARADGVNHLLRYRQGSDFFPWSKFGCNQPRGRIVRFLGQHRSNFKASSTVIVEVKPLSSVQEACDHFSLYQFCGDLDGVHNLYVVVKRLASPDMKLAVADGPTSLS